jgi:hypothetical protein
MVAPFAIGLVISGLPTISTALRLLAKLIRCSIPLCSRLSCDFGAFIRYRFLKSTSASRASGQAICRQVGPAAVEQILGRRGRANRLSRQASSCQAIRWFATIVSRLPNARLLWGFPGIRACGFGMIQFGVLERPRGI